MGRMDTLFAGSLGDELEAAAAAATASLNPPHTYVPWFVVDGMPIMDEYEQLQKFVCDAYQGKRPPACQAIIPAAEPDTGVASPRHTIIDAEE